MRTRGAPSAPQGLQGAAQHVERLDLLMWRFSAAEIERLSRWQIQIRDRSNMLDLPVDEFRMRFARWLVEHGRLGEGESPGGEISAVKVPSEQSLESAEPGESTTCMLPRSLVCSPAHDDAPPEHRPLVRRLLSQIYAFIERFAYEFDGSSEVDRHYWQGAEARYWGSRGSTRNSFETWKPWTGH